MLNTTRETLLRPEFTARYPNLVTGQWIPAAHAVDLITTHEMRGEAAGSASRLRLSEQHFTFRGGSSRGEDCQLRTRVIDPVQAQT